jgi:peroxiredoxin
MSGAGQHLLSEGRMTRVLTRIHPFTSLAVLLLLATAVPLLLGEPLAVAGLLVLAHGCVQLEFKKYTSHYQFILILLTALAIGISLDLRYSTWPMLTLAMLLAGTAIVARQAFMQQFTYVNLLWLDSGMSLAAAGLYALAMSGQPFAWDLWLAPLLPIVGALGLTFSYVQDGFRIRQNTRYGYKVQVGQEALDFELPDQDGRPVRLSSYRGQHPVLLIFVRGDWCPGCHMMLRTYERNRQRFAEKGVHVMAIGPDNIEVNRSMVARIGAGYRMLSDNDQVVSGQYGVLYANPLLEMGVDFEQGIPLPASFLIGLDGMVRYVSRPDRVGEFLDPELIFNALQDLPTTPVAAWN